MILTMDIGNSNIKVAVFQGEKLIQYWRIATNKYSSSDEYGILLTSLFNNKSVDPHNINGIIMSSVVPSINFTIEHMCELYFNHTPITVKYGMRTDMTFKYDDPYALGSDRMANAMAAYHIYGGPCIFIDFGTATTFGVVSEGGEFLGGAICPGLKLATEALVTGASKLPKIELVKPDKVIAENTITNMQAGIIYGYIGQVNYIVQRMKRELGCLNTRVIATGGMAKLISDESQAIDEYDGLLTLKGLRLLYEMNTD